MKEENSLILKTVSQLQKYNFYIPSYQRGYRWTPKQVNELLKDINDFTPEKIDGTDKETWYCLQPFALKRCDTETYQKQEFDETEEWFEVIDGQQRLTTIYLILHYLNQSYIEKRRKKIFKLNYATRKESQFYLKEKLNEEIIDDTNIDFFHITTAYHTIDKWFKDQEDNSNFDLPKFESKFSSATNVIWYEINEIEKIDSYSVFTRLNIGKIQLTNAELIKALFLKQWNSKENDNHSFKIKQLQIASEWDAIENKLQDDKFWYFLHNKTKNSKKDYANRIEYIFDLMKEKPEDEQGDRYTFYKFNDEFEESKNEKNIPDVDSIWYNVKKYFLTFEEWYNDRELYHYIGFLIATEYSLLELIKQKNNTVDYDTKQKYKEFLIDEITSKIKCNVRQLSYGDDRIKPILLMFNIQTILSNKNSNLLFPFDLLKEQDWDIEHIRSQTDKNINNNGNDRVEWAKDIISYFTGVDKTEDQTKYIEDCDETDILKDLLKITTKENSKDIFFIKTFDEIRKRFNENNVPSNFAISNLALLDSKTNRSYKNAFFPIKRKTILENDKSGIFVPLCTKNVFTKAYSKKLDEIMYWSKDDADHYLNAIEETLEQFIIKESKDDE